MSHTETDLRLSALRAFLGRVFPKLRLVKVRVDRETIILTAIADNELTEDERELISEAATEIVSDYPQLMLQERVVVSGGPIVPENIFDAGWVYRRFEPGLVADTFGNDRHNVS